MAYGLMFALRSKASAIRRQAEALPAFESARVLQERLARVHPSGSIEFQAHLAASHYSIGVALRATDRPAEALAAYESARVLRERLVREHPESPTSPAPWM